MSNWAHVSASFRIDDVLFDEKQLDFDELIGMELNPWSDEDWELYKNNKELFLPVGSEGSLHRCICVNPNKHSIAAYNVIVYGDLRDAENVEDILNWYKKVCNKIRDYDTRLSLRQSFIQVFDEDLNKEFTLSDRF